MVQVDQVAQPFGAQALKVQAAVAKTTGTLAVASITSVASRTRKQESGHVQICVPSCIAKSMRTNHATVPLPGGAKLAQGVK